MPSGTAEERAKVRYFRAQLKVARLIEEDANAAFQKWPHDKRIEHEAAGAAYRRAMLELWLESEKPEASDA